MTNTTMRDTNGEFVETLHSTLRLHEEHHGFKVVRRLGSKIHLKKALSPHVSHNSLRAGFSPARALQALVQHNVYPCDQCDYKSTNRDI